MFNGFPFQRYRTVLETFWSFEQLTLSAFSFPLPVRSVSWSTLWFLANTQHSCWQPPNKSLWLFVGFQFNILALGLGLVVFPFIFLNKLFVKGFSKTSGNGSNCSNTAFKKRSRRPLPDGFTPTVSFNATSTWDFSYRLCVLQTRFVWLALLEVQQSVCCCFCWKRWNVK